jgi:hypothetical protein
MMPYYLLHEIERPKSRAEIRQAGEQLGRTARSVTELRDHLARRITTCVLSLRGSDRQGARAKRRTTPA